MSDSHNESRYTIINGKRYFELEGELIEVVESAEEFDDKVVDIA